jgi:MFS superfamily sulfate permease-like transporter
MYRMGRTQFIPFAVTIVGIVFTDLLIGIGIGMVVGIMEILWNNFKTPYHFNPEDFEKGKPARIELAEDVSFLNKAGILRTLDRLPDDSHLIIDASRTKTIHPDIIEIIENFEENAKTRNIEIQFESQNKVKTSNSVKHFHEVLANQ